jgi:hypothetical protein
MNTFYPIVKDLITEQQKGIEGTAAFYVGEQLKEIAEAEPASAELLARDLLIPEMTIQKAEEKIKAYADKHKKGNCAVVPPKIAEEILRKFYGLSEEEAKGGAANGGKIDLNDFI